MGLRRTQRCLAAGAVPSEGLDESVAQNHQVASLARDGAVPGMASRQATDAPRHQTQGKMLEDPTTATWTLRSRLPTRRKTRTQIPVRSTKNFRRHREAETITTVRFGCNWSSAERVTYVFQGFCKASGLNRVTKTLDVLGALTSCIAGASATNHDTTFFGLFFALWARY